MATVIVICLLIIAIGLIIRKLVKDKKAGKSFQCGGDCSRCGGNCRL